MRVPRRSHTWIWAGRLLAVLFICAVASYLLASGLDKADKVASIIGALSALAALIAPYLLPSPHRAEPDRTPNPSSHGRIDLRHARGVQVNQSGENVQHNVFVDPYDAQR